MLQPDLQTFANLNQALHTIHQRGRGACSALDQSCTAQDRVCYSACYTREIVPPRLRWVACNTCCIGWTCALDIKLLHVLRVVRVLEVRWDAGVEPWRPHPSWCEPMLQGGK